MGRGRRGDTVSGTGRRPRGAGRRRGAAVACAVAIGLTACSDGGSSASAENATVPSSAGTPTASDSGASSPAAAGGATDSGAASSVPAAPSSAAAPAPAAPAAHAMTVTATEMEFELDSTDIPAGEWTITLTNEGRMAHDLVVEQDGEDIARTDDIGRDGSTTLTVTLTPGRYVFYCSVGNHRAMGMEVDVTVT